MIVTTLLATLAPIVGPVVVGWAGGAFTARASAKRKAAAEARKTEAEVEQVHASTEESRARAVHVAAQAGHVDAQATEVIKGSALDLLLAAQEENRRLQGELARERAVALGYVHVLADHLATAAVRQQATPTVVVVEQAPELTQVSSGR